MAMSLSPWFRSPFSDLTGGIMSHQLFGRCSVQEMQLMTCLEAYGLDRGVRECRCYLDDFKECHTLNKQFRRFLAMRKERDRQIAAGTLVDDIEKKTTRYVDPKIDSF